MKCSKHYDRDAVSTCVDCGKALCPECTNKFAIPLCDQCTLSRNSANKNLFIKNTVIMTVFFIIGFSQGNSGNLFDKLFTGYFFAGIPWGWSALNKITPNIFLFMSWAGWLIYFMVKIILSMIIGMFVTPFKIYGIIKGLSDAKTLEKYTSNINA